MALERPAKEGDSPVNENFTNFCVITWVAQDKIVRGELVHTTG